MASNAVQRKILAAIPIPALPGWESRMVLLEYPPGVAAQVHNHPVEGINYIIEGEVISQFEGGEEEHFKAGEVFIDLAETVHTKVVNPSKDKWLRVVVNYVIKVGEPNVKMV